MKFRAVLLLTLALTSNHVLAQGWSGSDGKNGANKTITAEGPVAINLSGERGGDGSDGASGSSGRCNSYTNEEGNTVNDDVAGGNGERGGHGGDGGNGGHLTVLFTDAVSLNAIKFISLGGSGGYGGDGGEGGSGCPSGSRGDNGYSGSDGKKGNLYLVASEFFPYEVDTSNQANKISDLMKGRNIVKNIWEATVKTLVAPGSDFGNAYLLKAYEYGTAQVVLKDASKIDPRLLNSQFSVVMDKGVTKIQPDYYSMVVAKHSSDSANAVLEIERLYNKSEFNSIGFETVIKKNNNRYIHFTTDKDLLPRPTLTMKLKVEVKGRWFKYHESFNGEVPMSMIETVKAGYLIDLDALPLKIKVPSEGKIRLTMNYKLQELDLKSEDEEVWVVKMKHVGAAEVEKQN